MPLLRQVAALLDERGADPVRVNLEIKYDALDAARADQPRRRSSTGSSTRCGSTAWSRAPASSASTGACCDRVGEAEPALARNLLVSPSTSRRPPTAPSPWFDGLAVDADFVARRGAAGLHGDLPDPRLALPLGVDDPAYQPFATAELVAEPTPPGSAVVPYVVDDAPTMRHLVRLGVDGLITNRPDRLRDVLADEGRTSPAFPRRAEQPPGRSERLLHMTTSAPVRHAARHAASPPPPSPRCRAAPAPPRGPPTAVRPLHRPRRARPRAGSPPAIAWSRAPSGRTVIHGTAARAPRAQQPRPSSRRWDPARHPDRRARRSPAGSRPTAPRDVASGAPATASRSRPRQGRRLLGRAGRSGRSTSEATGCCRSTRSRSRPGRAAAPSSARTARRARPATAARSTSTAPPRLLHLLARHRRPGAAPAAHLHRPRSVARRHHLDQRHRLLQRDAARWQGARGAPATTSSPTSPRTTATSSAPRRTPTASAPARSTSSPPPTARWRGRSPRPATAARRRTSTRSGRTPSTCSS